MPILHFKNYQHSHHLYEMVHKIYISVITLYVVYMHIYG